MIRVPMRKALGFNRCEPDSEPARVIQPDVGGRSDVDEDRVLFGAASASDESREAVAGEAQIPPWLDGVMAIDGRTMGKTRDQPGHPL